MSPLFRKITAIVVIATQFGTVVMAQGPSWWTARNVVNPSRPPDDFALANVGQLKNMASAAAAQLNAVQPGGAGAAISSMISGWGASQTPDDFAAANLGQAKAVAEKFYLRLQQLGVDAKVPWHNSANGPDDFSPINLGQLKTLFSFEIPSALQQSAIGPTTGGSASSGTASGGQASAGPTSSDSSRFSLNYVRPKIDSSPELLQSNGVTGGAGGIAGADDEDLKFNLRYKSYYFEWNGNWRQTTGNLGSLFIDAYYNKDSPDEQHVYSYKSENTFESGKEFAVRWDHFQKPEWLPWQTMHIGGTLGASSHYRNLTRHREGRTAYPSIIEAARSDVEFSISLKNGIAPFDISRAFRVTKTVKDHTVIPNKRIGVYYYDDDDPDRTQESSHEWTIILTIRMGQTESGSYLQTGGDPSGIPISCRDVSYTITSLEGTPNLPGGPKLKMLDIAGSSHRKIGLNGIPMPDEPPQKSEESDQPKEESYIDGYTLGLQHSTSDVYVPLGASSMPLAVNRHAQEYSFKPGSDASFHKSLTHPFGAGWGSGLVSYVEHRTYQGQLVVTVVDETGSSQEFLDNGTHFTPSPFSSTDAKSYLNKLERVNGQLVYTKKFGTTLTFDNIDVSPPPSGSGSSTIVPILDLGPLPFSVSNWTSSGQPVLNLGAGTSETIVSLNSTTRYLTFNPANSATTSGLAWNTRVSATALSDLEKWQTAVWKRVDTSHPYQVAASHPLEIRQSRSPTVHEYSAGVQSATRSTIKQPLQPPQQWMATAPSLIGSAPPLMDQVASFAPMSNGAHEAYMAAVKIGGVFMDAPFEPYLEGKRRAVIEYASSKLDLARPSGLVTEYNTAVTAAISQASKQMMLTASSLSSSGELSPDIKQKVDTAIGASTTGYASVNESPYSGTVVSPDVPLGGLRTFYRLAKVADRLGNSLCYTYDDSGGHTLIPARIYDTKRPGMALEIQHSGKQVAKITDPAGHEVNYRYRSRSVGGDSVMLLERVTFADGSFVHYGYDEAGHVELSTGASIVEHVNLAAIIDPQGHAWSFIYDFGKSRASNLSVSAAKSDGGRPRWVRCVTQPDGRSASFLNDREMVLTDDEYMLGRVSNAVKDVDGNIRTYVFGGMRVANGNIDSATQKATGTRNYVLLTTLDIHLGENLVERFEYDTKAGLALKRATDLCGNVTEYEYEPAPSPQSPGLANAEVLDIFSKYNDPITKTRHHYSSPLVASSKVIDSVVTYTYDPSTRVMKSMTDPLGRKTENTIAPLTGLRKDERHYDATGQLVAKTEFSYTNSTFPGFLTQTKVLTGASDPAWATDLVTTYVPDLRGRVQSQSMPAVGATTEYTYDAMGHKQSVTDPRGNVTAFDYDKRGRLTSVTYAQGTTAEARNDYTYDSLGNRLVEVNENGVVRFYVYDAMNRNISTILDLDGSGLPGNRSSDIVTNTEYNAFGQPTKVTDPNGNVQVHEYDGLGRLCLTRAAVGTALATLTRFYYEQGQNTGGSIFDSSSFKPNRVIDPRGYQTLTQYDALYRPVKTWRQYLAVNSGSNSGSWAETDTVYDDAGNPTTVTDALGKTTTTEYDALNRPTKVTFADNKFTTAAYTATGLKWQSTDELGRVYETQYDGAGRAIVSFGPPVPNALGTTVTPSVQTSYDAAGNIHTVTDERGYVTTTDYDERNRPILITMPEVVAASSAITFLTLPNQSPVNTTGIGLSLTGSIGYTAPVVAGPPPGVVKSPTILKKYDRAGNLLRVTDPLGYFTDTRYDNANRPVEMKAPAVITSFTGGVDNCVTLTTYDMAGHVLTVTDPEGRKTLNSYDPLGRLIQSVFAGVVSGIFGYDETGNRTSVADGKGNMTTFFYDGLNRPLLEQPPGANPPTRFYYNAIERTSFIAPDGQVTNYTYDDRHRLLTTTWATSNTRTNVYDDVGNLLSVTDSADGQRNVAYSYDSHNRVITETSAGVTHTYGYDDAGNRTSVFTAGPSSFLGDLRLRSTYDALNRLIKLEDLPRPTFIHPSLWGTQGTGLSEPIRTTTWKYDLAGRVARQDLPNGTWVENEYDAQGHLARRRVNGSTGAISLVTGLPIPTPIDSQNYLYDRSGNLRAMTEQNSQGTRSIAMDYKATATSSDDGRLRHETITEVDGSSTSTTYAYDSAGNRTGRSVAARARATAPAITTNTAYAYNSANQLMTYIKGSTAAVTFTYDKNGNRKSRKQGTQMDNYTWDAENHLIRVDHAATAKAYTYSYDYRCRRIRRDEGAERTKITYSGGNSVAEYAGVGATDFVAGPDKLYLRGSDMGGGVGGLLYSRDASSLPSFNHYNGRGDVVAKTDASGTVTWTGSYEAYGKRTRETGTNTDRQRANTKEEDPTGLLNEGRRYRDLETGTWLSRDPAGFIDGPNLYCYVNQNPWTKFDPLGLSGWSIYNPSASSNYQMTNPEYRQSYMDTAAKGMLVGVVAVAVATGVAEFGAPYLGTGYVAAGISNGAGGYVANGIENKMDGQPFNKGAAAATTIGAGLGVLLHGFFRSGGSSEEAPSTKTSSDAAPTEVTEPTKSCFLSGTDVLTPTGEFPIEKIKLGQRVYTPDFISGGETATEVDPATWREFHVRFNDAETGGWDVWDVSLLRPASWLNTHGSADGEHLWINLEEMHAKGWAQVVEVRPCPPIQSGRGRIVTATMTHANDDVRHLILSTGEDIGVTGNHRMYSADRHDWVPVKSLRPGERLQTDRGAVTIQSITANPGRHQVFNLEVEQDHCYFVGTAHSLAHNSCNELPESAKDILGEGPEVDAMRVSPDGHDVGMSDYYLKRSTTESTKKAVLQRATGEDGIVRSEITGKTSNNMQVDHIETFKTQRERAAREGSTESEWKKMQNDQSNLRATTAEENQSHAFEDD